MARARVLSFMSTLGPQKSHSQHDSDRDSPPFKPPGDRTGTFSVRNSSPMRQQPPQPPGEEPQARNAGRQRSSSRPMSMVGGYQPPQMQIASDTIPELAPIFTLLNSHSNKLYQEGYFLKLNDLDTHGRPFQQRLWTECFAQLVGTVLSLWDAAALDAAGEDGEVAPTFMNLADASIKMVETLPTRSEDTQPLTNVLSISTAGKNRFLFHFSSVNALTQWTAGIRLAMFENSSLQEAYTGSLIAGKGRSLNNIKTLMEKTRFKTEEWTRVRFGAGTPWRRCWCVISPADEKEIAAQRKAMKKKSAYDRGTPHLKGDIKFYDSRKITKKSQPIATIRDAYSAYAIYPQSKPLIDQSTLIKIEGLVTIHAQPEVTTEGLIFVMPEVRPAVIGFEMMLRFLFPIYDVFGLYGRPTRLIADTVDQRSLMFAMPSEKRYGYLEIFDIATLIHQTGSSSWSEREWKKQLKQLTSERIGKIGGRRSGSRDPGSRRSKRSSLPGRSALRFQDNMSTPSLHRDPNLGAAHAPGSESAPPGDHGPYSPPRQSSSHRRSVSETQHPHISPRKSRDAQGYTPSRLMEEADTARSSPEDEHPLPPIPPAHRGPPLPPPHMEAPPMHQFEPDMDSSDGELAYVDAHDYDRPPPLRADGMARPHSPVAAPPAFSREPGAVPQARPYQSPELRRANSRMSSATLSQLAAAGKLTASEAAAIRGDHGPMELPGDQGTHRGVNDYDASGSAMTADEFTANQGLVMSSASDPLRGPTREEYRRSASPSKFHYPIRHQEGDSSQNSLPPPSVSGQRSASPLSQTVSATDAGGAPPVFPHRVSDRPTTSSSAVSDPRASALSISSNRHSIARKPVPSIFRQTPSISANNSNTSLSAPHNSSDPPSYAEHQLHTVAADQPARRDSDTYSTDSPDYASTHESVEASQQIPVNRDRPRSGVLRTIGNADPTDREIVVGDARYTASGSGAPTNDFNVDFGPTHLYNPTISQPKSVSPEPFAQRRPGSRSNMITPEQSSRSGSGYSPGKGRSVAWQPGVALGSPANDPNRSLTPEEFVHHRYSANRGPLGHGRHPSSTPPRTDSRQHSQTPPLLSSRNNSGDWTAQPPRPHSRGASRTLTSELPSQLSAREQEHVARMTGSPLLNMAGSTAKPVPQGGLVSAIDARERERQDFKNFHSNMAVQQAIAQRQQHYGQPSPSAYVPGQFPPSPQYFDATSHQDYIQGPHEQEQWHQGPPPGYHQQGSYQQGHYQQDF